MVVCVVVLDDVAVDVAVEVCDDVSVVVSVVVVVGVVVWVEVTLVVSDDDGLVVGLEEAVVVQGGMVDVVLSASPSSSASASHGFERHTRKCLSS